MNAPAHVYDIVTQQEESFNQMLAPETDGIHWAQESQFAMQALQNNDTLNETAWKNKASLKNAIINVASIGISLNPANKHAYLVPRDRRVCLDISYMGLMHLAQQTGSILWGQAKLVYACDTYENIGIDKPPFHKCSPFASDEQRGEIIGVYCTVKTADGSYLTEEMNMDAINKIRETSKAKNGPWKTWPEEMMRKSVVKRGSKYWPKVGKRFSTAVDVLNQEEGLTWESREEKDITPVVIENPQQRLSEILKNRKAEPDQYLPWLSKQFKREITDLNTLSDEEATKMVTHMENAQ